MPEWYQSPRWSQEIPDCSMPMTFDTYSACSYGCHYCFSIYQRDIGGAKKRYRGKQARSVNPEHIKLMFKGERQTQFTKYIEQRIAMQWGGLSDQFDEYERKYGVSLELLRFFRDIEYPICFSTKAAWWAYDERYLECFRGAGHFNTKFSIIMLNEDSARKIEAGCPSPEERLKAMAEIAKVCPGGVTLRLRPYIIGCSDKDVRELIKRAADAGATAVSTEFFCLERRSTSGLHYHFPVISQVLGFDVVKWYAKRSRGSGYLRLTRDVKRLYVDEMQELCDKYGLRFYVSDAHFKERCHNGSCCGLSSDWNYARGQDCEALQIAKTQGKVAWSDIAKYLDYLEGVPWDGATGYNYSTCERRAALAHFSMIDYLRYTWNHPKLGQSPYMMFEGVLRPAGIDECGDLVYEIDQSRL